MAGGTTFDSRRSTTGATCDSRHSTDGCRSSSVAGRRAVAPLSVVARRLSLRCRLSAVVALSAAGRRMSSLLVVGRRLSHVASLILAFVAFSAHAENAYTNHAGNVVSGVVVALDARTTTISNAVEALTLPLSIVPINEQRRIAADVVQPRLPASVKRAIAGAEKAMERSRKRAEKGFCSREESEEFCEKSRAALKGYLDRQVESGTITQEERNALGL